MNYSLVEAEIVGMKSLDDVSAEVVSPSAYADESVEASSPEPAREVEIACEPISEDICAALSAALQNLNELKTEIVQKIEFAWNREAALEERLGRLMRETGSSDEQRKKVLGDSVAMYTSLLRGVIAEIDEELLFFAPFTTSDHPAVVNVPLGAAHDTSTVFFVRSVKLLKSQSKNIRKYLAVSYSRYMYGFDLQERNLERLEFKISAMQMYRQQAQSAA